MNDCLACFGTGYHRRAGENGPCPNGCPPFPYPLLDGKNLALEEWLDERYQNAKTIARTKRGEDRQGWLEDAHYLLRARESVKQLVAAHGDQYENVPIRMHIALKILRAWNYGTAGYNAGVVEVVNAWLDRGMSGPVPWPESPFFAEWADKNGYSNIGGYVGFKFTVNLTQPHPLPEQAATNTNTLPPVKDSGNSSIRLQDHTERRQS